VAPVDVTALRAEVAALATRSGEIEARVVALASVVDDGGSRLRALELRTQMSMDRLTGVVEACRRELRMMLAVPVDAGGGQGHGPDAPPDALLHGLERQLQEAEGRLARLTSTSDDGGGHPAPPA
jgi:hypothetical protein